MTQRKPEDFSRRILLVVTGKTPQIVTETLYKLVAEQKPAFVPTELQLITTVEGAKSARHALLGVGQQIGWFQQFCEDYHCTDIQFTTENIHVIQDGNGAFFLDDAESTEHNRLSADFITKHIQQLTEDPETALHVSLAGGRKTMSYYAGYALSLYGRNQDRLSHVLVNEPFQSNQEFFYPPPVPQRLAVGNRYFSTEEAHIILSDIPYVRMRYHVPEALLKGKAGFQETVEKIQQFMEPESVRVQMPQRYLIFNQVSVKTPPSDCAFYAWMAQRTLNQEPALCLEEDSFMEDYLEIYALLVGRHSGMYEKAEKVALHGGIQEQKNWFLQRKGKVHKLLEDTLGKRLAQPFLIETVDTNGKAAYRLRLNAAAIEIEK